LEDRQSHYRGVTMMTVELLSADEYKKVNFPAGCLGWLGILLIIGFVQQLTLLRILAITIRL
jgi:hypothetical protein